LSEFDGKEDVMFMLKATSDVGTFVLIDNINLQAKKGVNVNDILSNSTMEIAPNPAADYTYVNLDLAEATKASVKNFMIISDDIQLLNETQSLTESNDHGIHLATIYRYTQHPKQNGKGDCVREIVEVGCDLDYSATEGARSVMMDVIFASQCSVLVGTFRSAFTKLLKATTAAVRGKALTPDELYDLDSVKHSTATSKAPSAWKIEGVLYPSNVISA
jgi:hypothetical protein